jgi:hypothetical protein
VLKVEFESASGFRASYLGGDFADGGIRIGTSLEIGQRLVLHISFQSVEPLQIEAVVRWSLPATHADGPASGLAFVEPTPEAAAWLSDVLDSSTQVYILPAKPDRVVLLEVQPFLREIYSQEVRNWAELRDEELVEIVALDDPAAWLDELGRDSPTLAILDVDGLPTPALDLYRRVRKRATSSELPLIVVGSPAQIEPFLTEADDLLFCLRKPLRFGLLMNTVRMAARDD